MDSTTQDKGFLTEFYFQLCGAVPSPARDGSLMSFSIADDQS